MKPSYFVGLCAVALIFTSCEYSVINKADSEHLIAGDLHSIEDPSSKANKEEYLQALDSSDASVKGEAAYKLAKLADAANNKNEYISYLEMANENGHAKSRIKLADAYVEIKPTKKNLSKAKELYLSEDKESVSASLGLLKIAKKEKNVAAAKQYSVQVTNILERRIDLYGDFDGSDAIRLAKLYEEDRNFKQAEYWYRYSIDKGNVKATARLANMWKDNKPSAARKKEAFALNLAAANSGEKNAMKYIAKSYATGYGVGLDKKAARKWYKKIIEVHGDPSGSSAKKIAELSKVKIKKKKVANRKTSPDLGNVYKMLQASDAQQKKPEIYNEFVELANKKHILEAMIMVDTWNVSDNYAYSASYKKAGGDVLYSIVRKHAKKYAISFPKMMLRQWELAATFGSSKAAYVVAESYSLMSDKPFNDLETKKLYKRAADMGNGKAMLNMARRSLTDISQRNSASEAFAWFLKAAKAGEVEGQYNAGISYARGNGVKKDEEKAIYWLDKASKNGYKLATDTLDSLKIKGNNKNAQ